MWYVLETRSHGPVRLHAFLSGLGSMAEELEKREIGEVRAER